MDAIKKAENRRKDIWQMKKRVFAFFLTIVFLAALVSGCKKNVGTPEDNAVVEEEAGEESGEAQPETGKLFGFSCISLENPFYEVLKDSVENVLKEQGDRILVKDPKGDVSVQVAQIGEMIEAEVDAVFLCPADWDEITPALEMLREAGIPVINLDTEVREAEYVDAFVGSDNHNAGYVCGRDLTERMPDGGRIVIVEQPSVNSINERITGFEEAIANAGFEVVQRIGSGEDISTVRTAMEELLDSDPGVGAIMCGNDQMAEQVLAALEEYRISDVLVYSVDGSPAIKAALADPQSCMAGTGAQSPINMGKTAVDVANSILNGNDYEKETYEETFFINSENVGMYGTDSWQ